MKETFVINIHSVLDVITNSSSELFVIDDDTTVQAVEEMLRFMLDKWNEMAARGVFGQWYVKNKRVSLSGNEKELNPIRKFEDVFGFIGVYTEDMQRNDDDGWGYERPENVGKIVIESETDNSIPSEIMDWIESAFSAKRWHLG